MSDPTEPVSETPSGPGPATASPARPLSYEVEAQIIAPGRSEVTCKSSRIAFDSSPGVSPELPGPAELLAAAFSACLLMNVERFSEMLPFRQSGASVRVTVERQNSPPRFTRVRYELRVVTDEEPWRVTLLHENLRKFGTVYNTIAAACDVSGEILAEDFRHDRGGATGTKEH